MAYNMDELSSPDPLQDSPTYSSPVKTRNTTRLQRSLPLLRSSPRKQTFELDVGDQLSPQKIRVTVEAEHSDKENGSRGYRERSSASPTPYRAPTLRRKEKTTTTTIPVKGLSDSEDNDVISPRATPKRGRGRPRKISGTPVPAKSRTLNPSSGTKSSSRRRRTLGDMVDGDDEEDWDFKIGAGVEVSRGKGRSRSRSVRSVSITKGTPAGQRETSPHIFPSSTTTEKGRRRRKTMTPADVVVLEDDRDQSSGGRENSSHRVLAPIAGNGTPVRSNEETTITVKDSQDAPLSKFKLAQKSAMMTQPAVSISNCESPTKTTTRRNLVVPSERLAQVSAAPDTVNDDVGRNKRYSIQSRDEEDFEVDDLGDLPEFDTILESEGFSMISVDDIPSLREHLSSPIDQSHSNKNTPASIRMGISPPNQSIAAGLGNLYSCTAPEILESASLGRKAASGTHLTVRSVYTIGDGDSFSSIPPEVLEAATPARKPPNNKLLFVKGLESNVNDDSFSSIPPEVLEAATPARYNQKNILQSLKAQDTGANEDSFSSIPPEVLDAATPGKPKPFLKSLSDKLQSRSAQDDSVSSIASAVLDTATATLSGSQSNESQSLVHNLARKGDLTDVDPKTVLHGNSNIRNRQQRESSRLLTPSETPSPPQETVVQNASASNNGSSKFIENCSNNARYAEESSILSSQMKSSPPVAPHRFTYTAHLRQHRLSHLGNNQTPSIVFSSPSLPPLIQQPALKNNQTTTTDSSHEQLEAAILPSVRAGKALQDLSIPSSSRSRTQSLGSPFKSPITRRSSSAASGGLSSDLPYRQQRLIQNEILASGNNVLGGFSDDTRRELRESLMMGEEMARRGSSTETGRWRSSGSGSRGEDPFSSAIQEHPLQSPDGIAKYSLELPSNPRDLDNGIGARPSSIRTYDSMSWQPETTVTIENLSQDSNQIPDCETVRYAPRQGGPRNSENTTTSLLLQDQREEEWARERAAVRQQVESASTSQVIVLSSDNSNSFQDVTDEEEDIWQAEARHSSSLLGTSSQLEQHHQIPLEKPRRSKIPSPWRKNSRRFTYSDEVAQRSLSSDNCNGVEQSSQLIEKRGAKPNLKHYKASPPLYVEQAQMPFHREPAMPQLRSYETLASLVPEATSDNEEADKVAEEEPSSLIEASFMRKIPQKLNFDPRPRNHPRLDLSALLGSSPAESQHDDSVMTNNTRYDESSMINTSTALKSQLLGTQLNEVCTVKQQPTPSPERSSIVQSSPPFEHFTPEFTEHVNGGNSDTSTTNESITTTHDSEAETSSATQSTYDESGSSMLYPALPGPLSPNKDASPSKSCLRTPKSISPIKRVLIHSPTASPKPDSLINAPSPPPLSPTTWSKAHWKLLRALWLDYLELGPELFGNGEAERQSPFMGKTIYVRTRPYTVEAWHLDIVAAFREEVPGWEEGMIAKYLFAIIVCDKERKDKADNESRSGHGRV